MRRAAVALAAGLVLVLAPAAQAGGGGSDLRGVALSGERAVADAPVALVRTAPGGGAPTLIARSRTGRDGRFAFDFEPPRSENAMLYVTAGVPGTGRARAVRLAALLGTGPFPRRVTLNELTTVAAGYAEAQFVDAWRIAGPAPGPPNAAEMARNLANPITGAAARAVKTAPNGRRTPALETFNSLANALVPCVRRERECGPLLRGTDSTLQAMADQARFAAARAGQLFRLSERGATPYAPALAKAPPHWALMLRFVGDGESMNGPGNIAFDAAGNAWVANNYTYSRERLEPQCGSDLVLKFRPDGSYAPGSPYAGGGLSGVGYGITFDPDGHVWLSNFGFAAPGCPTPPPHDSVSEFNQRGKPLSPASGYTQGALSWPQGIVSSDEGDIWVANCGPYDDPLSETAPHDSLTIYPGGDPARARSIRDPNLNQPFDIAFNRSGQAFVSSTLSSVVGMYEPDGTPTARSPIAGGGLNLPMGVASDTRGNVWVSNSGVIDLPCPGTSMDYAQKGGSVTLISDDGEVRSPGAGFTGGGVTVPWGMAVDGNDNVWVSNFAGKRVSQFCGVRERECGGASDTGDPISPAGGWSFAGLTRNTAVEIDPSGNVWITNNWKQVPLQANPGGYQVVVMLGAAGPVRTPLVGQPEPLR